MSDLLATAAELVAIPSVSRDEKAIADHIESVLSGVSGLETSRLGDNLVGRTHLGREQRLLLAGHLDTVPPSGNLEARLEGDTLWGLGSADMKGGLAVLCALAVRCAQPEVDVTYVFYTCEEVEQDANGLRLVWSEAPDLLTCDAAILAEPTSSGVEAGCQGTLRVAITLGGKPAHTARPWAGVNAIHRLEPLLGRVAGYEPRLAVLDGCEFKEALQAVRVSGGHANNVVPDAARLVLNHRFAPDRDRHEALEHLREVLHEVIDESAGDRMEVEDVGDSARPRLGHPLLARLVAEAGTPPRGKLGWTDVAFFGELGIPAANFGPGDPGVAHASEERVARNDLEAAYRVLAAVIAGEAP